MTPTNTPDPADTHPNTKGESMNTKDQPVDELRDKILDEAALPRRKALIDDLEMLSYKRGFKEAEQYYKQPSQHPNDTPEQPSETLDVHGNPMKKTATGVLNDLLWKDITFEQAEAAIQAIIAAAVAEVLDSDKVFRLFTSVYNQELPPSEAIAALHRGMDTPQSGSNPTSTEGLELTRELDTIQRNIWAKINDEANARGVKLDIGDAYSMGSVIKEVLHPEVRRLIDRYASSVAKAELEKLKSDLLTDQDAMISNLSVRNIMNRRIAALNGGEKDA